MAISNGSIIEITMVMSILSQTCMNVFQYRTEGAVGGVPAADIAAGWWNHVKSAYRGFVGATFTEAFQTVRILELDDPAGDYGEYPVPVGERAGLRSGGTQSTAMPSFNAAAVRLAVSTRATRPGQKRFPGLMEADNAGGVLDAGALAAANALAAVLVADMTLGAPAALAVLQPVVVRKGGPGVLLAVQDVTGYLTNSFVSSQVSRKPGRGI